MIRAIIRPEKSTSVLTTLFNAGYSAVTKVSVVGRGKQKGIRVGDVTYDELPKEMLLIVIHDENKDEVIALIMKAARTGTSGAFGDGKLFVSVVDEAYTVSRGTQEL